MPKYASQVGSKLNFEQVAAPGFDDQGRARRADSAWSMRYFQADGADTGYLYVGTDNNSTTRSGDILPGGVGQIWVTDGMTFTQVITDGFGNPDNGGVSSLASFNGCLYAGTYNPVTGMKYGNCAAYQTLKRRLSP